MPNDDIAPVIDETTASDVIDTVNSAETQVTEIVETIPASSDASAIEEIRAELANVRAQLESVLSNADRTAIEAGSETIENVIENATEPPKPDERPSPRHWFFGRR